MSATATIRSALHEGGLVAVADGAGAPIGLGPPLAEAAADVGGVRLLLGWCFDEPADLADTAAFPDIRAFMGGYALRRHISSGRVRYLPVRMGALPALLAGPLCPDVVLLGLRPGRTGFAYGTEVAWLPAAVDSGATILAEINHALPAAAGEPELPRERVTVVAEVDRPPAVMTSPASDQAYRAMGAAVAELIPEGAAIQFGPGAVAQAVLEALEVPVSVDSGVVSDPVLGLDERGLLQGVPSGAYVLGGTTLYQWADGRPLARAIAHTHDISRLAERPFVAINTALQIDRHGQVNVEQVGGKTIGGIGGHGEYAMAGSRSAHGLSIIALPSVRGGHPTLVDRLDAPASTGYADVDVVVTEHGAADVRGLDPHERAERICALWPDVTPAG